MIQQSLFNPAYDRVCPRCGSADLLPLADLDRRRESHAEVRPDLAEWLKSPERPARPVSSRRRIGVRNAVAFAFAQTLVLCVAWVALSGALPSPLFFFMSLGIGSAVGVRTLRTQLRLARAEEVLMRETHAALFSAYLRRRRIWSQLRYCKGCEIVVNSVTMQSKPVYELHELANWRTTGVSLR